MKNKELIASIEKKIKGDSLTLKKKMKVFHDKNDYQEMDTIINDDNEWCLASGNDNWVVPLTELTNKELLYLRKCI